MTTTRAGFALVFSMLIILALAVTAMGILAVGSREAWIAASVARKAQAERRAEAAAIHVLESWSTRAVADLETGDRRTMASGHPDATVTIERLDAGLFLVRGQGRVEGPDGATTATAGLLVRALPPQRLAGAFPGALTAAGPVTITGGTVAAMDTSAPCETGPVPGIFAPSASVEPAASIAGDPPVRLALPPAPPAPDPFGPALAATIASLHPAGMTAVPRPLLAGGECAADARNWGSPEPGHPCYGLLPVVFAADLVVDSGVGRGVFVVDGDLRVTGGTRLEGAVVVRGRLELDGGSVIRGAVRAGSAAVADGTIRRDGCALGAALSTPALDRGFRPPARWWVPAL